jgi:hypothetical protein
MSSPSLTLQVWLSFRLVATDLCPELPVLTDGVVTLRPPRPVDTQALIDGRDAEFFRWIGRGSDTPSPVACVWIDVELVGWVDYELDREWLEPGEVNAGYYLFPAATLLIDPENVRSLQLAHRLGFEARREVRGSILFERGSDG